MDSFLGVFYGAFITWLSDMFFAILTGLGFILIWYFLDEGEKKQKKKFNKKVRKSK
jgi:putative Mn2+ efflux pump MntP